MRNDWHLHRCVAMTSRTMSASGPSLLRGRVRPGRVSGSRSHHFFVEPCETGFESTTGVVVVECGVDARGMVDPEHLEAGFEEVTDEDGGRAALGAMMERG